MGINFVAHIVSPAYCIVKSSKQEMNFPVFHSVLISEIVCKQQLPYSEDTEIVTILLTFLVFLFSFPIEMKANAFLYLFGRTKRKMFILSILQILNGSVARSNR